ncbi:MAG: hypothetical protein WAN36_02375, partial [Calditrichia bacterium]
ALNAAGLEMILQRDLTDRVQKPSEAALQNRLQSLQRLRKILPYQGIKVILDAFIGGIALQLLYVSNLLRYKMMVSQRHR